MARIHTVVEGYTGMRAGVAFVNGSGNTDNPHLIAWFHEHGYVVEEEKEEEKPVAPAQRRRRKKEA